MRWVFSVCMMLFGCAPRGETTAPTPTPIREAQAAPPAPASAPVAARPGGYIEREHDDNDILLVTDDPATARGKLDKEIIRNVVRAHIGEVRSCYNAGLGRDATLRGRVAIQFTIGPDGTVPVAAVAESDLPDAEVANCVANAVKTWAFPKPQGGGNVVVTYPFILEPG